MQNVFSVLLEVLIDAALLPLRILRNSRRRPRRQSNTGITIFQFSFVLFMNNKMFKLFSVVLKPSYISIISRLPDGVKN